MSRRSKTQLDVVDKRVCAAQPLLRRGPRHSALLMGTALSAIIGLGYGRGAYAQTVLSGQQTTTQTLTGPGAFVTADGFSVDTTVAGGTGINITTATGQVGDTTFTDTYGSSVLAATYGITADNLGTGALRITTDGDVTGLTQDGINASMGSTATDLTIEAANVAGEIYGVRGFSSGSGALSITATGDVTAQRFNGITATNSGTSLAVTAAKVAGGTDGITANNGGSGALTITATGDVTGQTVDGIDAYNYGTDMTIAAVKVTGYAYGVLARNYRIGGTGALSITTTGDVTGQTAHGIEATNKGSDLTINAAKVTGYAYGVRARNNGTGALSITTTGDVIGQTVHGIAASNDGTDLTVTAAKVTGATYGVRASNDGSGALSITTTGDVTGRGVHGIAASNDGTDLTINAAKVTGSNYGVFGSNDGTGALSITTTGDVTGQTGQGIAATNKGTDLIIDAAKVTGGVYGIIGRNYGTGELRITATSDVTGQNVSGIGGFNDGTDLIIDAAKVTGATYGVRASNDGSGELRITATGDVTAQREHGIYAINQGTDLTIDAAKVTGGNYGVLANNNGTGALRVTATGEVTGQSTHGISARNSVSGTSITIEATKVTGNVHGISAGNDGSGALRITATGEVTGQSTHGISARNSVNGTSMTIEATKVTGGIHGISAGNDGSGELRVTATGDVTGRGVDGISASNQGTDLTIDAAKVTGGIHGISAGNDGSGELRITATGDVTGQTVSGIAGSNDGTDLTIDAAKVTGQVFGIYANNDGTGALSITTTGDVIGTSQDGIEANNSTAGTGLTIAAHNVTGYGSGIEALQNGAGALSITATGDVIGTSRSGLYAYNTAAGTDLTITANNVSGGGDAIYARQNGTGTLSITTNGTLESSSGNAIDARDYGSGGVDIDTTGSVSANSTVIYAGSYGNVDISFSGEMSNTSGYSSIYGQGNGSGNVTINSSGNVTGGWGISGVQRSAGGNVKITSSGRIETQTGIGMWGQDYYGNAGDVEITSTGTINSYSIGIVGDNRGPGNLTISSTGRITTSGDVDVDYSSFPSGKVYAASGIFAYNNGNDLTIDATAIQSASYGIIADNDGTGALSITTTGDVTGETKSGVRAQNAGTDLSLEVAKVNGKSDGIYASNTGTGFLTLTATGKIEGQTSDGLFAVGYGTYMTIETADVTGFDTGIAASNLGSGALSITANGAVTGGTGDGIYAYNASSADLTITIAQGGSVSTFDTGASDFAIEATAPNGAVIVNNFGTVTGRVNLSNSNLFTNNGVWNLANTTSDVNGNGNVNTAVTNAGLIIAARNGATDEFSAIDNLDVFRNNPGGVIRLADGGAGDAFAINGDINAAADDPGVFVANGGRIELDLGFDSNGVISDVVAIGGDVTRGGAATALAFNSVGAGVGGTTNTGIQVIEVVGTSDADAFTLAGPVEVGAMSYTLSRGDCTTPTDENWYLCDSGTVGTTGAVFEAMPGLVLNSFSSTGTLQQRLDARVQGAVGTLSTQGDADLPMAQAVGTWMRSWGDFAKITPSDSTAASSWETDSWGLEAGVGTVLSAHAGGDLVGGLNLRYRAAYTDLSNPVGTASLNAEGFGVAASLTWFGNDGFYVDGNAAIDFVSIDAASQMGGTLLNDHEDVVFSASAEVGKRFALKGGTTLVPQVQLSWGKMRDGSLTDNLGNVVRFADRVSLTSRIGLTVEQDVTGTAWGSGKVFGFGNVLHDLEGNRSVTVAGTDVSQSGAGDWVELGGGFSLEPTERTNLFGRISYREAFSGVNGDAIAVSAGWQMQW